MCID